MKKWILIWGSGCFFCFMPLAFLEAAQLFATMDKTKGSLEDSFLLTLTIREAENIIPPQLPPTPDFETRFQGKTSQTQWINGKMSSQIEFQYSLFPLKVGTLIFPAVKATLDGKEYQTQPIHLYVSQASELPPEQKTAFVQNALSVKQAYPQQQILYTFELYLRKDLQVSELSFERPKLDAFQVTELGEQEPEVKRLGGLLYEVFRVHLILYPQKTGTLTIQPAILHGQQILKSQINSLFEQLQSSFFTGKRRPFQLRTTPLTLKVLPIPQKNQPQDYYGLVGIYEIEAAFSREEVEVGESATLNIIVTGTGRAESVRKPLLNFDKTIKVYEDQPTYTSDFQGKQQISQTTFSMAIVPSEAGSYHFSEVSLPFFNPHTQSFETRKANIPKLTVTPGESQELQTVGGRGVQARKVERLGEDLLPIHQEMAALRDASLDSASATLYGIFLLLGPFCFGIGWLWKWKAEHSAANIHKIRNSQAEAQFQKKIQQLYADIAENQPFATEMMVAVKSYIGDKANKYGEALTSQEICVWLQTQQVPEKSIHQLNQLLEQCEMIQYAASSLGEGEKEQIFQAGQAIVKRLETQLK